jgi:hypothetical protein
MCLAWSLTVTAALAAVGAASPTSRIFWVSEPVSPGQTALLGIVSQGNRTSPLTVSIEARQNGTQPAWVPLTTFGATAYGVAVTVPPTFHIGSFEVRIAGVQGSVRSALPPPPHLSVSSVDRHGCNRIRSNCTQLLHVVSPTERALHGRPSREPFNECSSEAVICTVCSYWSARCNVIFAPRAVLLRVNNATQSRKPRNFHLERSLHPPLDLHNTPVKTTRAEICR